MLILQGKLEGTLFTARRWIVNIMTGYIWKINDLSHIEGKNISFWGKCEQIQGVNRNSIIIYDFHEMNQDPELVEESLERDNWVDLCIYFKPLGQIIGFISKADYFAQKQH